IEHPQLCARPEDHSSSEILPVTTKVVMTAASAFALGPTSVIGAGGRTSISRDHAGKLSKRSAAFRLASLHNSNAGEAWPLIRAARLRCQDRAWVRLLYFWKK